MAPTQFSEHIFTARLALRFVILIGNYSLPAEEKNSAKETLYHTPFVWQLPSFSLFHLHIPSPPNTLQRKKFNTYLNCYISCHCDPFIHPSVLALNEDTSATERKKAFTSSQMTGDCCSQRVWKTRLLDEGKPRACQVSFLQLLSSFRSLFCFHHTPSRMSCLFVL